MDRTFLAPMAMATLLLGSCAAAPPAAPSKAPPSDTSPSLAAPAADPEPAVDLLPPENPPSDAARDFKTDFSRHTVPYAEILSGGPPRDGIPAIDAPKFESVAEAGAWLGPREPVILVQVNDSSRAYPLQVLLWHEIVNDTVGGIPLLITYCPLCNTAIAFERTLDGEVLSFGTTGRLRYSNLIMYDRQTETWWQQAGGNGIAGEHAGRQLAFHPATILGWSDFRDLFPTGLVLSRETGFQRDYGRNPYAGYDDVDNHPFLYQGPVTPGQLLPMERVLTVEHAGEAVAYPYPELARSRVINDSVGGRPVVVLWTSGTASALDAAQVADGRDVGTGSAFEGRVDGQALTFQAERGRIRDVETGSEWDATGRAVSGPLAGRHLEPVVAVNHFWFSWAAFKPQTRVYPK